MWGNLRSFVHVSRCEARRPISVVGRKNMRRLYLIELFAGTHSVSNAVKRSGIARDHDFRVLSVDIDAKFQPSVVADISTWRFKSPIDNFLKDGRASDIVAVHASRPCTEFSRA